MTTTRKQLEEIGAKIVPLDYLEDKEDQEQILKKYIRKCCKKAWDARHIKKLTKGRGWKNKYPTFASWWRINFKD